MRFIHHDGWFADLPDGTDTSMLKTVSISENGSDTDATIVMRGVVVSQKDGWNVVSCYGLFVSGEGEFPIGSRVTALLS